MSRFNRPLIFLASLLFIPALTAAEETIKLSPRTADLLGTYCTDCHEDGTTKGDVRLDNLSELALESRLDLLNKVERYWMMEPGNLSGSARQEALTQRYEQRCEIEEQYGRLDALRKQTGW